MVDARGIIGNYLVERELGRGGMGVVYAAKHRVLGRPAAIKLLLANTSDDRGRVERFFNEARAAMAIDHPGVVKIYDVGISADDRPYIAMELLDGTSLASLVAPAGLPIRQGVEYACQIASALTAAHDAGVIHRDLKPENIIITRDRSRAIVVDFGIAKLSQQATVRTATGALVGTPLYMSPEQCEGLRDIDARSDLYSFGCVIFAMLTGRPPFFEGGTGGLIGMHLHVAPPPLRSRCANASEALERVVSVLLAKSPDARFRTARAALAALQAPEVRGLAAAPGVQATADVVQGNRSVQPWAATPSVPSVARDAQTAATGIGAHVSGTGVGASGADAGAGSMAPGTAFGVPASRDAWTQVTGADFRDPRTAAVQAVGTPSPSSSAMSHPGVGTPSPSSSAMSHSGVGTPNPSASHPGVGTPPPSTQAPSYAQGPPPAYPAHAMTPPAHAMTPSAHAMPHAMPPLAQHGYAPPGTAQQPRRKLIIAIVASSALTAIIAIVASRGCGGSGGSIDAGVASGSGSAGNVASGSGSAGSAIGGTGGGVGGSNVGSGTIANAHVDAGVDAAVIATNDRVPEKTNKQPKPNPTKTAAPKGTQPKGTATANVQIDPNGPPLGQRPKNEVPGAGVANNPQPTGEEADPPPPVVRREIHDAMQFQRGDWAPTLGSRALDRVAANHKQDPTRRIVITAYAENDEPGVLATLAENRGKTAVKELQARGVSKSVIVMNSTLMIEGTRDGSNRRVTFDFE